MGPIGYLPTPAQIVNSYLKQNLDSSIGENWVQLGWLGLGRKPELQSCTGFDIKHAIYTMLTNWNDKAILPTTPIIKGIDCNCWLILKVIVDWYFKVIVATCLYYSRELCLHICWREEREERGYIQLIKKKHKRFCLLWM